MSKLISVVTLFLLSSPLLAATNEMDAATAPSETVDMIWFIIFGVGFVAMIVGFFIYLWWNERNKKPE